MSRVPMTLGWTLLHFIWQAAAVLAIYKCIGCTLRFAKPATRYGLALIALACMALAAVGTLFYEAQTLHQIPLSLSTTSVTSPVDTQGLCFAQWRLLFATVHFSMDDFMPCLDLAWLSGVVFFAMRTFGGLYALKGIRGKSWEVPSPTIERLRTLVAKMNLSRSVAFRLHPYIASPFVAGCARSIIYLPVSAFTQLDSEQLDAILIHELAHIRRADFAWNLVQRVIETLFFFHPAVWYLSDTLHELRELCCDDDVLAVGIDPLKYARALLALASLTPAPLVAMASDGHQTYGLLPRVARILDQPTPGNRTLRQGWTIRYLLTGAGIILMTIPIITTSFISPANQIRAVKPVPVWTGSVFSSGRVQILKSQHRIGRAKHMIVRALAFGTGLRVNSIHSKADIPDSLRTAESTEMRDDASSSTHWTVSHPRAHANAAADAHAAAHAHAHATAHLHVHDNNHKYENVGSTLSADQAEGRSGDGS